jgi:curved DNA-binding protein CbpA
VTQEHANPQSKTRSIPTQSRLIHSHYAILGLHPSASVIEIRRAYRELSKTYHPDTTTLPSEVATRKFQRLNEAYGIISNPERRSLIIYGYFDPCIDELTFIEAICKNNSVFYSLYEEHHLFTSQKRVLEQFKEQGWTMRSLESSSFSTPGAWLSADFLQKKSRTLPSDGSILAT